MAKEVIKPQIMSAVHKVHPYQEGLVMFKSDKDPVYHRIIKPNKAQMTQLMNGHYGNVQSFYVFKSDSLEDMEAYAIGDLPKYIESNFKDTE